MRRLIVPILAAACLMGCTEEREKEAPLMPRAQDPELDLSRVVTVQRMTLDPVTVKGAVPRPAPAIRPPWRKLALSKPLRGWRAVETPPVAGSADPVAGLALSRAALGAEIRAAAHDDASKPLMEKAGDIAVGLGNAGADIAVRNIAFGEGNVSVSFPYVFPEPRRAPQYGRVVVLRNPAGGYFVITGRWPPRAAPAAEKAFTRVVERVGVSVRADPDIMKIAVRAPRPDKPPARNP